MTHINVLEGYLIDAPNLVVSLEIVSSAEIYAPVAHLLPRAPARIADIGAGTGRDAAWFVAQGHQVLAVEPTDLLREAGRRLHPSPNIAWLSDTLPNLERALARGETFDRVILCGVWHHLRDDERELAMPNLARLVEPEGYLILSLRHGPGAARRPCYPSRREDVTALATASGLRLAFACEAESVHPANRALGVTRTWLAFAR
jgi:SAM-dependent methyltransferase